MKKLSNTLRSLFLISICITVIFSCKKEEGAEPAGSLELWDNVVVPSQNSLVLDTNTTDFLNGVYTYNFNESGTLPVSVGDIIVGEEGEGFIRKVLTVSQNNGQYTFTTEQATLEDVFKSGEFNFNMDMAGIDPAKVEGLTFPWSGIIHNDGGLKFEMLSSNINFNPNWNFDFGFNTSGISKFEMSTYGSSFSADAELKAEITQNVSLNKSDTISVGTKKAVISVPVGPFTIPIVVRMGFYLIADYSASVSGVGSGILNYSASSQCDIGLKYENQNWQSIFNVNPTANLSLNSVDGSITGQLKYAWRPHIVVWIAGVKGPYINLLSPNLEATYRRSGSDWDFSADAFLKTAVGANVAAFGKSLGNYGPVETETERLTSKTPEKIERVSGDAQTGGINQQLTQPLKVRILDSGGNPQSKVPVYFTVKSGGGSVNPAMMLSDANGYAQTTWIAGPNSGLQQVEAKAKKGDGSLVNNAPVDFVCNIGSNCILCAPSGGATYMWSNGASVPCMQIFPVAQDYMVYLTDNNSQVTTYNVSITINNDGEPVSNNPAFTLTCPE